MKNEDEAVTKLLKPILKEQYFVKTSVRVDRLHSKLKTEGILTSEEISVKHPFHPDVDILFWAKDYAGEPVIMASEVKYFRLRDDAVFPNIYEGLGEALMLLSFGVDYVYLWHLFDPEIPSETVSRYRDLTQSLVTEVYTPINYHSWLLPEIPNERSHEVLVILKSLAFHSSILQNLKSNPIMNRWDAKIMRSIIKKGFRIVSK